MLQDHTLQRAYRQQITALLKAFLDEQLFQSPGDSCGCSATRKLPAIRATLRDCQRSPISAEQPSGVTSPASQPMKKELPRVARIVQFFQQFGRRRLIAEVMEARGEGCGKLKICYCKRLRGYANDCILFYLKKRLLSFVASWFGRAWTSFIIMFVRQIPSFNVPASPLPTYEK